MSNRSPALAIFGVFFFESAVIGQWIPRIPDIKSALGLSDLALGMALLSLPFGTLLGLSIAGRIIENTGLRLACRIFLPAWALLFILPGLAQTFSQLFIVLALSGIAIGLTETAMNTEAARLERASGKRLMSRCHGFWSLGTMAGALLGGALAQLGMSVTTHFLLAMPLIAVAGYYSATALPILSNPQTSVAHAPHPAGTVEVAVRLDGKVTDTAGALRAPAVRKKEPFIRLPARAIVLLCVMPLGIMMVEGAFIDWSAVFMRDVMAASPWVIGVTYSFFAIVMAVVRLLGDAITNRFGDLVVVRVSGIASTVGILLFALAPDIKWAFVAAAIAGAGVAIVFPLAVTAAANRPGRSAADNVASLNMIAFSAFLLAPPLIGFLSESFGLRVALLCLAPLAFVTFILAAEVQTKEVSLKPQSGD